MRGWFAWFRSLPARSSIPLIPMQAETCKVLKLGHVHHVSSLHASYPHAPSKTAADVKKSFLSPSPLFPSLFDVVPPLFLKTMHGPKLDAVQTPTGKKKKESRK